MRFKVLAVLVAMMVLELAAAFDEQYTNATVSDPWSIGTGWNGPTRGLKIACLVGTFIAFLLVCNRITYRILLAGGLGFDDLASILATMCLIAQACFAFLATYYGYGISSQYAGYWRLEKALLMFYIFQILYKVTINLVKISILALYVRLFTPLWIRLTSFLFMCVTIAAMLAFFFGTIFQCVPIQCTLRPWDPPANAHHINVGAMWKANAIWNIVSDVVIMALPLTMVRNLYGLTLARRINLGLMFCLGIVVVIAAILRFTTLGQAANGEQDILTSSYTSTLWTQIESSLAVSCPSLPMLRQLLAEFIPCMSERHVGPVRGWVLVTDPAPAPQPVNDEGQELNQVPAAHRGSEQAAQPMVAERIGRAL